MKLGNVFPKFDPRLVEELRTQSKPIKVGLACTVLANLLKGTTIGLVKSVTDAIADLVPGEKHRNLTAVFSVDKDRLATFHSLFPQVDVSFLKLQVPPFTLIEWCCSLVLVVYALRYFFMRGQFYYLGVAANRLAAGLRLKMFDKLNKLPVSYFNENRTGSIQSVLTNDVNVYQNAVGILNDSIEGPIRVLIGFGAVAYLSTPIGAIALLLLPVMMVVIQRNARKMRKAQHQVQVDLAAVSATTQESIQGMRVIKAFGAADRVGNFYKEQVMDCLKSQTRAIYLVSALRPLVELIGASALAVLLLVCGLLAQNGTLTAGTITAIAISLDSVNQGFRNIADFRTALAGVQAASERIYTQVLEVPEAHEAIGTRTIEHPLGAIEFKDVTFCYPDGTEALSNVSFKLNPGESLALVGPSGAGKSTIADLVLRFYEPTKGEILLDGVNLMELDPAWLRAQIGVVPQQTFLFAGNIDDNIRLGAPDAPAEDVRWALETAHATEFVQEMSDRPTSELGERGVRLSGGQMQRIAIARALVRKPTILVLDEATSALDAESEKQVTDALDEVMKARTSLFIAHRLTTAARADRIMVLSRGRVVEMGSHTELMEANGPYAGLFRAFAGGVLG